jgi:hypothetical protein
VKATHQCNFKGAAVSFGPLASSVNSLLSENLLLAVKSVYLLLIAIK